MLLTRSERRRSSDCRSGDSANDRLLSGAGAARVHVDGRAPGEGAHLYALQKGTRRRFICAVMKACPCVFVGVGVRACFG